MKNSFPLSLIYYTLPGQTLLISYTGCPGYRYTKVSACVLVPKNFIKFMFSTVYRETQKDFYARDNIFVEVRRGNVYSDRTQLPRHVGELCRPTDTSRFHIPAGRCPPHFHRDVTTCIKIFLSYSVHCWKHKFNKAFKYWNISTYFCIPLARTPCIILSVLWPAWLRCNFHFIFSLKSFRRLHRNWSRTCQRLKPTIIMRSFPGGKFTAVWSDQSLQLSADSKNARFITATPIVHRYVAQGQLSHRITLLMTRYRMYFPQLSQLHTLQTESLRAIRSSKF
jgi:hypothetical protein